MAWVKSTKHDLMGQLWTDGVGYTSYYDIPLRGSVTMSIAPTSNCQIASIGSIYNIVCMGSTDRLKAFKVLVNTASKNQLILDIQKTYETELDALLEEAGCSIVFKNPYRSTNDSSMIMYLVNVKNLR